MKVNKYLILHSGDRILMCKYLETTCIEWATAYFNKNLDKELERFKRDVRESASHIELVLSHKDRIK